MMKDNTVLITGVNGFIGSRIAKLLVQNGYRVVGIALDDREDWRIQHLGISVHYADIRITEYLESLIQGIQPQVVIHTAAMVDTSRNIYVLPKLVRSNLNGTVNLLHACSRSDCSLVINTGSSDEYGDLTAPFNEEMREMPTSPYGICKLATTRFARSFSRGGDMNVVTVRPFLVYGEAQVSPMLIPYLIMSAITRNPVQLTPGYQTRDPIHVDDLARGYLAIMDNRGRFSRGDVVNLAGGEEHSVREIAETVRDIEKTPEDLFQFGAKDYREDEPMRFFAEIDKMKRLTGWSPAIDLKSGLERTIDWYRFHREKWKV